MPTAVAAMKLGIVDFLEMKCAQSELGAAMREALRCDAKGRRRTARTTSVRRRLARLTPGQREVLEGFVAGSSTAEWPQNWS